MRVVSIVALSLVAGVLGAPSMSSRADWKIPLGWDGKSITAAEFDPSIASKSVQTRADALPGGVYMCQHANWGSPCVHVTDLHDGVCLGLAKGTAGEVSSFGPDPGLRCSIYSDWACTSGWKIDNIVNPGFGDLTTVNYNDVMGSFKCWRL